MIQNPNNSIWFDTTHHGKRYEISKSKIKNKIPTRKNLTEKGIREDSNGSNPHSYADTFSLSGFFSPSKYEALDIIVESAVLISNNTNIPKNSILIIISLFTLWGGIFLLVSGFRLVLFRPPSPGRPNPPWGCPTGTRPPPGAYWKGPPAGALLKGGYARGPEYLWPPSIHKNK